MLSKALPFALLIGTTVAQKNVACGDVAQGDGKVDIEGAI